ncbi:MAG: hypothetical protein II913_04880 [Elusimicrobiaceae bacterium]|nr:hypothetical protein [Elusimicrobiaceae bacterium]
MTSFQTYLRAHRPLCVTYESVRWLKHKLFGWAELRTPVWYGFDCLPQNTKKESLPIDAQWYHICRPLYMHEHVYYNLDNALAVNPNVRGFAFIFFMGIGDYLYTTPVLEALKKKYPTIPFYGYVGKQFDRNNSPLVGKLLSENPHFEKVFYFDGMRHPLVWKNYDYSVALKDVPENFLVIPVYYEYGTQIRHRVSSLFDTFDLPIPENIPAPQMYFPATVSVEVANYLEQARNAARNKKGIVFLQLDSRGSNYVYPFIKELALGLIKEGYFVMSVTKGGPIDDKNYLEIDIKKLSINQTWQLLATLKKEFSLYVIAVNSVFWAASAGLDLPNLGLQHWIDKKVHNLWYPNIQVVTDYIYPLLPREKQIQAPPESYTRHNKKIIDYKPTWILRWFKETFGDKR